MTASPKNKPPRLDPERDLDAASYGLWLDLKRDLNMIPASPRYLEGLAETLAQCGRHLGGDLVNATRAQLSGYLGWVLETRSAGTAHKRWRDLRRDQVLIHGKGRHDRWVPLSAVTARAFSRYARARDRHPAADRPEFFLGLKGALTRSGLRTMLNRRAAAAGLPHIHPHAFRHTATIEARRQGYPDTVVAYLNGWKSTRMCEVYGRAGAELQAAEFARAHPLTARLVTR